ncbi:MAG TPA: PEP-CTERM sorting domain-containing protein [Luteitalea sp.]|nr:PEP-CTERM sorting domain-containing protein [Luteitalea sp.]
MLRRLILASALCLGLAHTSFADSIAYQNGQSPYSLPYSASSSPFEAFEWTPLDLAAFAAYGGDFVNVRKPVTQIAIIEDLAPPPPPGPDDEQVVFAMATPFASPYFEGISQAAVAEPTDDDTPSIPEPGALLLIGLGMLGASSRLRRAQRRSVTK